MNELSSTLRLAAIDFLNAAPLMRGLEGDPRFRVTRATPAACAAALVAGEADLGVIPVIELARIPGLRGIGGLGVAARRQVRSILLISRGAPASIARLALDPASRTSAALVQILLAGRWGARFELAPPAADWRSSLAGADAVLVIGDPALRLSVSGEALQAGFQVRDLAAEWFLWTGLPFVFAVWGVREPVWEAAAAWLPDRLREARRRGAAEQSELVAAWSQRLQLPAVEVRRYLEHDVEYDLGADHLAGLRRFFALAAAAGLVHTASAPALWAAGEGA